jgi:hypothetical protein
MIRDELNQLPVGRRELRKFGLVVGAVFLLLALWFGWRGRTFYPVFLVPGLPLVILGALLPQALKSVYRGWMTLALVLGLVVSSVVLTLFFYLVVTPVGLLARIVGKDFLNRKLRAEARSYWIARESGTPRDSGAYERQF